MLSLKLFLLCTSLSVSACTRVEKAMKNEEIVPNVIPVAPRRLLQVAYPSGAKVSLGNKLGCEQVKDVPSVNWPADPNKFYTLCMIDPDAPWRHSPTNAEWHHWLVGNIHGKDIGKGETLSAYIGAGPPPESGFHRYVLLVYKQPSKLTFNEPRLTNRSRDDRAFFSISKFALKYNLGTPVAGNFFQAEFDQYVQKLYGLLRKLER